MGEKLNVKTTLLLTESDKNHIDADIQKLTEQLEKRFGVKIKIGRQKFLRGCVLVDKPKKPAPRRKKQ